MVEPAARVRIAACFEVDRDLLGDFLAGVGVWTSVHAGMPNTNPPRDAHALIDAIPVSPTHWRRDFSFGPFFKIKHERRHRRRAPLVRGASDLFLRGLNPLPDRGRNAGLYPPAIHVFHLLVKSIGARASLGAADESHLL